MSYALLSPDEQADAEIASEQAQRHGERVIRQALSRPGSNVNELLRDNNATNEWFDDIDALVRMAAQPFPDHARIGLAVCRMTEAAIGRAAGEAS